MRKKPEEFVHAADEIGLPAIARMPNCMAIKGKVRARLLGVPPDRVEVPRPKHLQKRGQEIAVQSQRYASTPAGEDEANSDPLASAPAQRL